MDTSDEYKPVVAKPNQHYVWQYYLKAWTVDRVLHCLRGGRRFPATTRRVAYEKNFYRAHLTEEQFALAERTANTATVPRVRKLHTDWIARLRELQRVRRFVETISHDNPGRAAAERELDAIECNIEDDHHTKIESDSISCLDALRRADVSCFDTLNEFISFTHFLAHQYMRTTGAREQYSKHFIDDPAYSEGVWPVLAHIFGNNISYAMFCAYDRHYTALLRAPEGGEFLTSDRPVMSTVREAKDLIEGITHYYPLSPTLALYLGFDGRAERRVTYEVSDSDLARLNRVVVAKSHRQVFASRPESLDPFMSRGS